jgi:hypothetical protein
LQKNAIYRQPAKTFTFLAYFQKNNNLAFYCRNWSDFGFLEFGGLFEGATEISAAKKYFSSNNINFSFSKKFLEKNASYHFGAPSIFYGVLNENLSILNFTAEFCHFLFFSN